MADKTTSSPTNPTEKPVADETQDLTEVRLEKLRQIEALGIDPWGHRFDDTTPIGEIRKLPAEPFDDAKPGPQVRAAGRVVRYRTGGKLLFLEIWDQTGRVQLMIRVNKVTRDRVEGRAAARPRRPDRRGRRVRQDEDRRTDHPGDEADVPDEVAGAAPEGRVRDGRRSSTGCGTATST